MEFPAELAVLAGRLPARLRMGTSSWSFPGWAGLVYAQRATEQRLARHGLAAYAACPLHRTVGLDRSFYKPPGEPEYRDLASRVPDGFRFLVKAWQGITRPDADERGRTQGDTGALREHGEPNRDFLDTELAVDRVIGPAVRGLGDRLGPLVFQFPPLDLRGSGPFGGVHAFLDLLEPFLGKIAGATAHALIAVEVRNREVFDEPFAGRLAAMLRETGVCVGFAHHPALPTIDAQRTAMAAHGWAVEDQPAFVCRWLLRHNHTYRSAKEAYAKHDYSIVVDADVPTRRAIADAALCGVASGRPGWIIVNNKAEGSAPLSVRRLATAVADASG